MRDDHEEESDAEDEHKEEQDDEAESKSKDTSDDRHHRSNNLRLQIERGHARKKIEGRRVYYICISVFVAAWCFCLRFNVCALVRVLPLVWARSLTLRLCCLKI